MSLLVPLSEADSAGNDKTDCSNTAKNAKNNDASVLLLCNWHKDCNRDHFHHGGCRIPDN